MTINDYLVIPTIYFLAFIVDFIIKSPKFDFYIVSYIAEFELVFIMYASYIRLFN